MDRSMVIEWQRKYAKNMMKAYKNDLRIMENRRKGTRRYNRHKKKCIKLMEFKHQNFVFYRTGE